MPSLNSKPHVPNPAAWVARVWDRMPAANNNPCLKGWAKAFKLSDNDPRVLEAVDCFVDMCKRTEAAVEGLRGMPEAARQRMLAWTAAIDEVVHQTAANGAWVNLRAHFSPVRREQLAQCEAWLDEHMLNVEDTRSYLKGLQDDIDAMRADVEVAELEDDFRRLLLDILEALRRAVTEYEVRGSRGVFADLGEIISIVSRHQVPMDAASQSAAMKVWELTKRVGAIGATFEGIRNLLGIGLDALERLPPP